jgi:uncharacterized protein DUF1707
VRQGVLVMAVPGDDKTTGAADRGHLRASHADRERMLDTLKAAFVQGRLTKNEFDLRIAETFAARTYAGLAAVSDSIPADLAEAEPLREPTGPQARRGMNKALAWSATGLIPIGIFAAAILPDNRVTRGTLAPLSFLCFMVWLVAGVMLFISWHQKLTRADGDGAERLRRSVKAKTWVARAAVFGLFGLVMPAAFTVAAIPGNTAIRVVVTYAAIIFGTFWLAGAAIMLASRYDRARTRPS